MKYETARQEIESLDYYLQNHTNDYSEESHTAMMMAVDALGSSGKSNKWIPVSEGLPKDGGDYLVTIHFEVGGKEPVREVRRDYFCILSKKWLYENDTIVAWMPQPEPYQEREEIKEDTEYQRQVEQY